MTKTKYFFKNIFQKFSNSRRFLKPLILSSTPYNPPVQKKIYAFTKRRLLFTLSLIITFLVIYGMLFYNFRPEVIFSNTTTAGGDTGAHNYLAKFFLEELFPNFRMTGWDMGWFAGIPMFTFYFPIPFFLIALLSKIITFNISFKLVTILGSIMLPAALYYFGRSFKFKYPYPEFAAIGGIAFLYMDSFAIYGANFKSTLAGEFSYSISFALIFLFLGSIYRGMKKGRFDLLFIMTSLTLAFLVLTHLITLIAVLIIIPSFLFLNRSWKTIRYIIAVFILGFFISAFWSVPFVLLVKWTPPLLWTNIYDLAELFPKEIIPAFTLAAIGVLFSGIKRDKRVIPLVWTSVIFIVFVFSWSGGRLFNGRFFPIIFIFIYLLAAYGLKNLYWVIMTSIASIDVKGIRHGIFKFFVIAFVPIVAFTALASLISTKPSSQKWAYDNYSGFESREDWETYNALMEYLDSLPYGRVMYDYEKAILIPWGTSRALELIPFWTKQPTMEGLLAESSLTSPFHYINKGEFIVKDRTSISGWPVPNERNHEASMLHLMYYNITYIMASSPEVIDDLDNDSRVKFLNRIEPFSFYEIIGPHDYVEVVENMPYRFKTDNWVWEMRAWYWNASNVDNPVLYDDGSAGLQKFEEITLDGLWEVSDNPIDVDGEVVSETLEREKIEFTTTAVGVPHLVKVSYFPNWKARGAEGPYLVSPSLMMVIPTQNDVTLYYGMSYANKIGVALSILGLVIILLILILNFAFYLKRDKKNNK